MSDQAAMEGQTPKYRKKHTNFKRQAKKFSRKGGRRVRELSDDQYKYYMNIFELLKTLEGEEKELMVQNFLRGLSEEEEVKKLASNQIISRILDSALPHGEAAHVLSLTKTFSDDIRTTCMDPYASHVLQTLMSLSLKFTQNIQKESNNDGDDEKKEEQSNALTEEQREEFASFLNKVGRFVYNNLDEFIKDTYGSHILRSVLETCSGVEIKDSIKSSNKSQTTHSLCHESGQLLKIPQALQGLLSDLADRLMMLPNLPGIITIDCSSAALQSALLVLKGVESKKCSLFVNHIHANGFAAITPAHCNNYEEGSELPLVFQSSGAVRLLEVLMSCATTDQLSKIFADYFKGHMSGLVQHRIGNFAVQKLLSSWQDKETFYELFNEVQEVLPAALEVKNTGVIFALSQACRKLEKSQGQCWKVIAEMLQFYQPQERQVAAAQCILWLQNYDDYQKKHASGELPPVSLYGSLILQEFLQYIKTIKMVTSILAMNLADLQLMACDPRGSHIISAFTSSNFIKKENKERLIHSFKGSYTALACSKHGSRSLEDMWSVASIKVKTTICEELINEEFKLKGNHFGAIIYFKFMVRLFKKNDKQDWQEVVDSAAKKKRLLDDLLTDVATEEPKKTKKKTKYRDDA